MLDQFASLSRRRFQLRRRLLAIFAYPTLLLSFIAALLILCDEFIAADFKAIFHDMGMRLPDITQMYFDYSGVLGWTALTFAIATMLVPAALGEGPFAVDIRGAKLPLHLVKPPFVELKKGAAS